MLVLAGFTYKPHLFWHVSSSFKLPKILHAPMWQLWLPQKVRQTDNLCWMDLTITIASVIVSTSIWLDTLIHSMQLLVYIVDYTVPYQICISIDIEVSFGVLISLHNLYNTSLLPNFLSWDVLCFLPSENHWNFSRYHRHFHHDKIFKNHHNSCASFLTQCTLRTPLCSLCFLTWTWCCWNSKFCEHASPIKVQQIL